MIQLQRGIQCGKFLVKIATSEEEVQSVQRLRFQVFNEELGEGIAENRATGLDQDEYDPHCDHLMLIIDSKVIATYRLLHGPRRPSQGFYTETEFSISSLPIDFNQAVELGRACVDPNYRMKTTLMTVFWGLHLYVVMRKARYLIGCTSLSVQTPDDAEATFASLQESGHVHMTEGIEAHPKNTFKGDISRGRPQIPSLMSMYLEFGAKVYGRPAYDPIFRCYDMFVVFDMDHLSEWGLELLARFDKRLLGQNTESATT